MSYFGRRDFIVSVRLAAVITVEPKFHLEPKQGQNCSVQIEHVSSWNLEASRATSDLVQN